MASTVTELLRRRFGGKSLPYDAEIEYLETDGNAYINTLTAGGSGCVIEGTFLVETFGTYGAIFGNYISEAHNVYRLILTANNNNTYYTNGNNKTSVVTTLSAILLNSIHTFELHETYIVIDGTTLNTRTTQGTLNETNFALFARAIDGTRINAGTRIYDFKISRNNVLERDFIPVRIGNVGYMYDKVSKQLFGNAGTGDFILGNDK